MSSEESDNPLSREELEERIVAMLMGELDAKESGLVEKAIAEDEVLRQFHRRMQLTFGFVQEAMETSEVSKAPAPMRLSRDRREALFAKLRTVELAKTKAFQRHWNRKLIAGLSIAAGLAVLVGVGAKFFQGHRQFASSITGVNEMRPMPMPGDSTDKVNEYFALLDEQKKLQQPAATPAHGRDVSFAMPDPSMDMPAAVAAEGGSGVDAKQQVASTRVIPDVDVLASVVNASKPSTSGGTQTTSRKTANFSILGLEEEFKPRYEAETQLGLIPMREQAQKQTRELMTEALGRSDSGVAAKAEQKLAERTMASSDGEIVLPKMKPIELVMPSDATILATVVPDAPSGPVSFSVTPAGGVEEVTAFGRAPAGSGQALANSRGLSKKRTVRPAGIPTPITATGVVDEVRDFANDQIALQVAAPEMPELPANPKLWGAIDASGKKADAGVVAKYTWERDARAKGKIAARTEAGGEVAEGIVMAGKASQRDDYGTRAKRESADNYFAFRPSNPIAAPPPLTPPAPPAQPSRPARGWAYQNNAQAGANQSGLGVEWYSEKSGQKMVTGFDYNAPAKPGAAGGFGGGMLGGGGGGGAGGFAGRQGQQAPVIAGQMLGVQGGTEPADRNGVVVDSRVAVVGAAQQAGQASKEDLLFFGTRVAGESQVRGTSGAKAKNESMKSGHLVQLGDGVMDLGGALLEDREKMLRRAEVSLADLDAVAAVPRSEVRSSSSTSSEAKQKAPPRVRSRNASKPESLEAELRQRMATPESEMAARIDPLADVQQKLFVKPRNLTEQKVKLERESLAKLSASLQSRVSNLQQAAAEPAGQPSSGPAMVPAYGFADRFGSKASADKSDAKGLASADDSGPADGFGLGQLPAQGRMFRQSGNATREFIRKQSGGRGEQAGGQAASASNRRRNFATAWIDRDGDGAVADGKPQPLGEDKELADLLVRDARGKSSESRRDSSDPISLSGDRRQGVNRQTLAAAPQNAPATVQFFDDQAATKSYEMAWRISRHDTEASGKLNKKLPSGTDSQRLGVRVLNREGQEMAKAEPETARLWKKPASSLVAAKGLDEFAVPREEFDDEMGVRPPREQGAAAYYGITQSKDKKKLVVTGSARGESLAQVQRRFEAVPLPASPAPLTIAPGTMVVANDGFVDTDFDAEFEAEEADLSRLKGDVSFGAISGVERNKENAPQRRGGMAGKVVIGGRLVDAAKKSSVARLNEKNAQLFDQLARLSEATSVDPSKPDLVAAGTFVESQVASAFPLTAVTNQFTNGVSVPTLDAADPASRASFRFRRPAVQAPSKKAERKLRVASVPTVAEPEPSAPEEEPPAPVRPKKPKTLKPKPEILTKENAFSTFSLNVSDVAFKLAVASLNQGKLPEPDTVRSEEFINALNYHDPAPRGKERLAFSWERARNPFAHDRDLIRFSVQTAARGRESGQPLNLVVLLDASGSMERADRVKIVREMLAVLAGELKPQDKISVVAFARTPWLLVDGMAGGRPKELLNRILNITPQGGTNLETGLNTAYSIARRHFNKAGNNRVIILTDGAANLGNIDPDQLKAKVEQQRKRNIALDCFGVGWEGYNDTLLETLSRNGDGRYGFINDPGDARHGFANLLAGALQVAAANVKTQIEFNTNRVVAYRQIGYDKHQLKKEQFRDNTVDAAEIGAAESGTAMYSLQVKRQGSGPLGTVRVRYKIPATGQYVEEEWELPYDPVSKPLEQAKPSMRLATVAASFAEWLTSNPHAANVTLRDLQRFLTGVPEEFSSDERPKQLATMLQQARRISGE